VIHLVAKLGLALPSKAWQTIAFPSETWERGDLWQKIF